MLLEEIRWVGEMYRLVLRVLRSASRWNRSIEQMMQVHVRPIPACIRIPIVCEGCCEAAMIDLCDSVAGFPAKTEVEEFRIFDVEEEL